MDMSDDVSRLDFERMRDILLSLLMKMEISGSNCPMGARVAIVSYSNRTDYLVRLSDHKAGPALLQVVRGLSLAGSSGSRRLGDAMRFVARHVFKRVRAGRLLRKVAVFFQAGLTLDAGSISTAMLELSALDIAAAVITFTEDHGLPDALLVSVGLRLAGVQGLVLTLWGVRAAQGKNSPETDVCVCVGDRCRVRGMSRYRLCCQRYCWCLVAILGVAIEYILHALCLLKSLIELLSNSIR